MPDSHKPEAKTGMTLSVIGCGNMATAILSGVINACEKDSTAGKEPRFSKFHTTVNSAGSVKRLEEQFAKHKTVHVQQGDNIGAMLAADVILFGFKPYMVDLVLREKGVKKALANKFVISVLAGSPPSKLFAAIYEQEPYDANIYIKRALPNLAAQYGESMTVIESSPPPTANAAYDELTDWIFMQLGKIHSLPTNLFDIGGVLAGTSSAFLSVAVDGMLDGAVSQGVKRADAKEMLVQTLISLATLLQHDHPAVIREKVSSPKGTTIAGLMALEEDGARWAFTKAVVAASKRSEEIEKQG